MAGVKTDRGVLALIGVNDQVKIASVPSCIVYDGRWGKCHLFVESARIEKADF